MGPNLMLSWLVRAQVGAKRGKLMLLGRLRGTKLELKRALRAPKEAPREPLGEVLGASWEPLESLLGAFLWHLGAVLDYFGAWKASSKRFAEILKNLEKCYKVLQKSRFGGSQIHEKLSLEGNLGPNLMLSWLVRAQVGAKRGKLTPTWRLRGTKLELKGGLGAPKEAPRQPKRARVPLNMLRECCEGSK